MDDAKAKIGFTKSMPGACCLGLQSSMIYGGLLRFFLLFPDDLPSSVVHG
jgi:hypothetical protein